MSKDRTHKDECLPCPVCGSSNDHLYVDDFKGKFQVVCDVCQSSTRLLYPEISRAIFKWNCMIDTETDLNVDAIRARNEFRSKLDN